MIRQHYCPKKRGKDKWANGPVDDCKKHGMKLDKTQASVRKGKTW